MPTPLIEITASTQTKSWSFFQLLGMGLACLTAGYAVYKLSKHASVKPDKSDSSEIEPTTQAVLVEPTIAAVDLTVVSVDPIAAAADSIIVAVEPTVAAAVDSNVVAVEPVLSRIPTGGTSYTTPEKDYRTLKKLAQVSDKETKSLNEDFMIKTLTDFESLCNDVVFQRQKSVYLHKIWGDMIKSCLNWVKRPKESTLKSFHEDTYPFFKQLGRSLDNTLSIQDKVVSMQVFIDKALRRQIINVENTKRLWEIRPNLNGVEFPLIRDENSQSRGIRSFLPRFDKPKSDLKSYLTNFDDSDRVLLNCLKLTKNRLKTRTLEVLDATSLNSGKCQKSHGLRLKAFKDDSINSEVPNIAFYINSKEDHLLKANLENIASFTEVVEKTSEILIALSHII